MKRTTYILIGSLVTIFVVMVGLMVYITGCWAGGVAITVSLKDEMKEGQFNGIRSILVFCDSKPVVEGAQLIPLTRLTIVPSDTFGVQTLTYPACEHVKVAQVGDVLRVDLELQSLVSSKEMEKLRAVLVDGISLELKVDSMFSYVQLGEGKVDLLTKGLTADSLVVRASLEETSQVRMDSCCFRSYDLDGKWLLFEGNNSRVENLYLNLTRIAARMLSSVKFSPSSIEIML